MSTMSLSVIVGVLDRATAPLRSIAGGFAALTASAVALTAAMASAAKLEDALTDAAITADATGSQMAELYRHLENLSRVDQTNQSVDNLLSGFRELVSAGMEWEKAMQSIGQIGRMVTAANADMVDASKTTQALVTSLGVAPQQLIAEFERLTYASKQGSFEFKDMARNFASIAPNMKAIGLQGSEAVATLGAALQTVKLNAGTADVAANNLENLLGKLFAPDTTAKFKEVAGIDFEKVMLDGMKKGENALELAVELTEKALAKTKGGIANLPKLFQDKQARDAIQALIQNRESYERIKAEALKIEAGATNGIIDTDYERRIGTVVKKWDAFANSITNIVNRIGAAFLPIAGGLLDALLPLTYAVGDLAQAMGTVSPGALAAAGGMALAAASAGRLAGLLVGAGGSAIGIGGALIGLLNPVRLVSGALTVLRVGAFNAFLTLMAPRAMLGVYASGLAGLGRSLFALVMPTNLLALSWRGLTAALVSSGVGAILVGIGLAALWVINNWDNLGVAVSGFGVGFRAAIEPVMPALRPVIDILSVLWDAISSIAGPVEGAEGAFGDFGVRVGYVVGMAVGAVVNFAKNLGEAIREGLTAVGEFLGQFSTLPDQATAALTAAATAITGAWQNVGASLSDLWAPVQAKWEVFGKWFSDFYGALRGPAEWISSLVGGSDAPTAPAAKAGGQAPGSQAAPTGAVPAQAPQRTSGAPAALEQTGSRQTGAGEVLQNQRTTGAGQVLDNQVAGKGGSQEVKSYTEVVVRGENLGNAQVSVAQSTADKTSLDMGYSMGVP